MPLTALQSFCADVILSATKLHDNADDFAYIPCKLCERSYELNLEPAGLQQ